MKQMTKAEEQVMQILWDLNESNVRNIVDQFDIPKPAYTTVATVLKVLEKKGFVTIIPQGKTHLFIPQITKEEYSSLQMGSLLKDYFNGSFSKMASFFAKENNLSISDLEEMIEMTKKEINKDK
ncbi:BlaI/MecI/CopY family transcriptional regulator [Ancylomarina euxinus]|uniref:BlaI/MecI/CopY family transcriptional regulator n=1 Tax=Ancylomarina euxinus TaxID=2283627 RepID=A0A425Y0V2_9BACT|nr:BlaI/MecI/CopY family transcriptional regulator [Ancylomarina euxinus]MCZ4693811.1 BlaI/MecI/CopY family transcriptional regulator [Ancylomarina euxinus]MUP15110.1 BlaI/MecI/CopY family transcriptional regulator [Ancylomarina euxinus]RRG21532.1 BlaI/MecI/CopY family transcriptional regulator [Ancylomarina euxinus]